MEKINFNNLFIFDLANNHQGDLEHGLNIINAIGGIVAKKGIRGALKFQFRNIETFIHPEFIKKKNIKHIPRFVETALHREQYATLLRAVKDNGLLSMCTPFDEESVELILDFDIEIIKIASCSATDWPLIGKITKLNKPVVASTAGLSLNKIDRLVNFLDFKGINFALMHCVALYPTGHNKLNLNQIENLKTRYPNIPIGFSTHEKPDEFNAIQIALAKGATLFERHVGLETEKHKLNKYSSTPEQIRKWIDAYQKAAETLGGEERTPADPAEIKSLSSLMRGVYAKKGIKENEKIKKEDVFFAMPLQEGQLNSSQWIEGIVSNQKYEQSQPLDISLASIRINNEDRIFSIMLQIKGLLNKARIYIGKESSIEISHHYGLERFREFGAVIINCINRAYCKKLIVMLPRQKHPYHFHDKKEETFQLLYGDFEIELEGRRVALQPGDTFLVEKKKWHKFHTLDGAIIEEISTTHYNDDSFYEDEEISFLPREERKTQIPNWEDIQMKAI